MNEKRVGRPYVHFYLVKEGDVFRALTKEQLEQALTEGSIAAESVVKVKVEKTYKVKNAKQELVEA